MHLVMVTGWERWYKQKHSRYLQRFTIKESRCCLPLSLQMRTHSLVLTNLSTLNINFNGTLKSFFLRIYISNEKQEVNYKRDGHLQQASGTLGRCHLCLKTSMGCLSSVICRVKTGWQSRDKAEKGNRARLDKVCTARPRCGWSRIHTHRGRGSPEPVRSHTGTTRCPSRYTGGRAPSELGGNRIRHCKSVFDSSIKHYRSHSHQ